MIFFKSNLFLYLREKIYNTISMEVNFNNDIIGSIEDYVQNTGNMDYDEIIEYLKTLLTNIYTEKYLFPETFYQYLYYLLDNTNARFNFNPTESQYKEYRLIREKLLELPQFEQRTDGWYKDRYNKITASDCNAILAGKSREYEVMMKKLDPLAKSSIIEGNAILHGKEFEQVITEATEIRYNRKIYEYGCIPHHTHSFIGASPDGITDDGIMIEIKCPYSRTIEGLPMKDYWVQMQLQMECCNLNLCYFIEGKITNYEDEEAFLKDKHSAHENLRENGMEKGLIIVYYKNSKEHYIYPENTIKWKWEELSKWRDDELEKLIADPEISLIREDFFKIDEYSITPVYRDREWFDTVFPIFKSFWDKVLEHRKNGTVPEKTTKEKEKKSEKVERP